MSFAQGTSVVLTAAAASGQTFSGWSGACTGTAACMVTMSADLAVTATFVAPTTTPPPTTPPTPPPPTTPPPTTPPPTTPPPTTPPPTTPPPADECAGLLPASLPARIQATLPQNGCIGGTTDDGNGTFALGFINSGESSFPEWLFFTIQDGKAVQIGSPAPGTDNTANAFFSQPSGFTKFAHGGAFGTAVLETFDHGGNKGLSTRFSDSSDFGNGHFSTSNIGIDPSGGTALALQVFDTATGWRTVYQRLDQKGAAETGQVLIDSADRAVFAVGVALSGHALVVVQAPQSTSFQARWVARDGTALTNWFDLPGDGALFPAVQFLMDGNVVVSFSGGSTATQYKYEIADGKASVSPAPDFLQKRPGNTFQAVRNGRGYASWGDTASCAKGSFELLTTSGKSCGCTAVPGMENGLSIGRDGSLIVGGPAVNFGSCVYGLYPKVLK